MAITPLPRGASYSSRTGRHPAREGRVLREVALNEIGTKEGDFRKLIQLIRWNDGQIYVRFGYYVKDSHQYEKDWHWGSQNTFLLPIQLAKELIHKAQREGIL